MCVVMVAARAVNMAWLTVGGVGVDVAVIVVMVCMPMIVRMTMAAGRIGATFRLEGRCGLLDCQVHGVQHVGQHMIRFDLEVIGLQLDLHMAVAQVVGRAHQIKG